MRAVLLDIGGVLEYTPATDHTAAWEAELGLAAGELDRRMLDVWRGGSLGTLTEEQVHAALVERLGFSPADLDRFLTGVWDEYCGSLNAELTEWFAGLRPRYGTGIVSNSFVGARERKGSATASRTSPTRSSIRTRSAWPSPIRPSTGSPASGSGCGRRRRCSSTTGRWPSRAPARW